MSRVVHAVAGREQYERHVRAVWKHLPDDMRGEFLTGVQALAVRLPQRDVIMVGGWEDIPRAGRHDIIYVEHGAGQAYQGDPATARRPGYHGGPHPDNVRWYISPRADVAQSWGRPAFAAGCPALDRIVRQRARRPSSGYEAGTAVAITFHWKAGRLCPEAGSAVDYYEPHMADIVAHLRAQGFGVFGHWHPRAPTMRKFWRGLGVDQIPDIDSVLRVCDMVIADNTSAMYEAAALDLPVLALNCPEYRRGVDHGLRFWDHVPGWQIDTPGDLLALDVGAYWREDWSVEQRRRAIDYCYARPPGDAGKAAAEWLLGQLAAH